MIPPKKLLYLHAPLSKGGKPSCRNFRGDRDAALIPPGDSSVSPPPLTRGGGRRMVGFGGIVAILFSLSFAKEPAMELSKEEKTLLLHMARASFESCVKREKMPAFTVLDKFKQECGAFVTLKEQGELRGCIGHIYPVSPLFQTVTEMAEAAALHDTRFSPVEPSELKTIDIEISVLTPPVQIPSLKEFVIGKHGIIINLRGRQAVFLPQVAVEQKWDKDTTLRHLCIKAGLPADAYLDKTMEFRVFEAIVFGETE